MNNAMNGGHGADGYRMAAPGTATHAGAGQAASQWTGAQPMMEQAYGGGAGSYSGQASYGMPTHPVYAYPRQAQQQSTSLLGFGNDRFMKGLLIGAAATYLLTNESVQRTLIKGVVQVWSTLQGGIEEVKERFHDAEAEIHHAAQSKSNAP
jgi:hypothetical protein